MTGNIDLDAIIQNENIEQLREPAKRNRLWTSQMPVCFSRRP